MFFTCFTDLQKEVVVGQLHIMMLVWGFQGLVQMHFNMCPGGTGD